MVEPVWVVTVSSPEPPGSGISAMVLVCPAGAALPTPWVPRMPMVATGVVSTIASGALFAIWPLTKLNTPSTIRSADLPVCAPGS